MAAATPAQPRPGGAAAGSRQRRMSPVHVGGQTRVAQGQQPQQVSSSMLQQGQKAAAVQVQPRQVIGWVQRPGNANSAAAGSKGATGGAAGTAAGGSGGGGAAANPSPVPTWRGRPSGGPGPGSQRDGGAAGSARVVMTSQGRGAVSPRSQGDSPQKSKDHIGGSVLATAAAAAQAAADASQSQLRQPATGRRYSAHTCYEETLWPFNAPGALILTQQAIEESARLSSNGHGLAAKAAAATARRGSSIESRSRTGRGSVERSLSASVYPDGSPLSASMSKGASMRSSSALPVLPAGAGPFHGAAARSSSALPTMPESPSGSHLGAAAGALNGSFIGMRQPQQKHGAALRSGSGSPPQPPSLLMSVPDGGPLSSRGPATSSHMLPVKVGTYHQVVRQSSVGPTFMGGYPGGAVPGPMATAPIGSPVLGAAPHFVGGPVAFSVAGSPEVSFVSGVGAEPEAEPSGCGGSGTVPAVPGAEGENALGLSKQSAVVNVKQDGDLGLNVWLMPSEIIKWRDLQLLQPISTGSFGEVYLARYKDHGCEVSVKRCIIGQDGSMTKEQLHNLEREINTYRTLDHPAIVRYIGCVLEHPNLAIVTEYVPNGNVFDLLYMRRVDLPAAIRLKIATTVALAIQYMHSCDPIIIHRDLKTQNLVLDADFGVKLCDFGKTQALDDSTQVLLSQDNGGSPRYMAPECFQAGCYLTEKVDIWSLGCCLVEVFGGPLPYEEIPQMAQVLEVMLRHRQPPLVPPWFSPEVKPMLAACFEFEPLKRIEASGVQMALKRLTPEDLERHGMDKRRTH